MNQQEEMRSRQKKKERKEIISQVLIQFMSIIKSIQPKFVLLAGLFHLLNAVVFPGKKRKRTWESSFWKCIHFQATLFFIEERKCSSLTSGSFCPCSPVDELRATLPSHFPADLENEQEVLNFWPKLILEV